MRCLTRRRIRVAGLIERRLLECTVEGDRMSGYDGCSLMPPDVLVRVIDVGTSEARESAIRNLAISERVSGAEIDTRSVHPPLELARRSDRRR